MQVGTRLLSCIIFLMFLMWVILGTAFVGEVAQKSPRPKAHGILANYFEGPISFEPNLGQADARVRFLARGAGYNLFLTPRDAEFYLRRADGTDDLAAKKKRVLSMTVIGANPKPKITGRDELPGKSSYFFGSNPRGWHTNIPNFGKVQYENVYPGIDLVFHGTKGQLEYDFLVHPGATPRTIAIKFTSAQHIKLDSRGELVLQAGNARICFHKPVAYQQADGNKRSVIAYYQLVGKDQVGFVVGAYDLTQALIIDPVFSLRTTSQEVSEKHSSNTSVATVPPSVKVPAGAKSVNFTVSTSPVTQKTRVKVAATLAGVKKTAVLVVTP